MSAETVRQFLALPIGLSIALPGLAALVVGLRMWLGAKRPTEGFAATVIGLGLTGSFLSSATLGLAHLGLGAAGELDFGSWLRIGLYDVPLVFLLDHVAVIFSVLAAALTGLVARFSRTYLHREPGFVRFYVLLGLFAMGSQLVALSGGFDLFFAGWELIGVSSTLFIGFFFERPEPVRSSLRAFATYRACDVCFFLAIVATHELLGSTRLSVLTSAPTLPLFERNVVAGLFLVAALGKSAQFPFSSWLSRAMEGPTPSSALFYGGISIHAGLYLMLRVWPLLDVAPAIEDAGIVLGLVTAAYGAVVARAQTDAKGALAMATLSQTGLILAEIAAGWTQLALVHLVGHALLRMWQYLRAPNTLHDAHARGDSDHGALTAQPLPGAGRVRTLVFALALHRLRLDDAMDVVVAPVLWLAGRLSEADAWLRRVTSFEGERTKDGGR